MGFSIQRVLVDYLSTTSYGITEASVNDIGTIRTCLLVVHVVLNDEAATTLQVNHKASYVVVKGFVTPSKTHVTFGEFKHVSRMKTALLGKESGATERGPRDIGVKWMDSIPSPSIEIIPGRVKLGDDPTSAIFLVFVSEGICIQYIHGRIVTL
jgi:hypothetical protein